MKFFINLTVALLLAELLCKRTNASGTAGKGKVSGAILDEKSQPFPFVNVSTAKGQAIPLL